MWILEWRLFRAVDHSQKLFPAGNKRKIFSHSFVNISKYRWPGASGPGNVEGLPGSLRDGRAALWPRAQSCWAASGSQGHIGPAVTSLGADLIAVLVELMARTRFSSCFPPHPRFTLMSELSPCYCYERYFTLTYYFTVEKLPIHKIFPLKRQTFGAENDEALWESDTCQNRSDLVSTICWFSFYVILNISKGPHDIVFAWSGIRRGVQLLSSK